MKQEKERLPHIFLIIHILCVILLAGTLGTCFRYSAHIYFSDAVRNRSYEESQAFYDQLVRDIHNALKYAEFQETFETDGELDFEKTVSSGYDENGETRNYTLQDALDYGQSVGITFSDDNRLILSQDEGEDPAEKERGKKKKHQVGEGFFDSEPAANTAADTEDTDEGSVCLSLLYRLAEYYELRDYLGYGTEQSTNFLYRFILLGSDGNAVVSSNAEGALDAGSVDGYGKYFALTSEKGRLTTNVDTDTVEQIFTEIDYDSDDKDEILVAVDLSYRVEDQYSRGDAQYRKFLRLIHILIILAVVWSLGLLASFVLQVRRELRKTRPVDAWYTELVLVWEIFMLFVTYWGAHEVSEGFRNHFALDVIAGGGLFVLAWFPAMFGFFCLARKAAHRQLVPRFLVFQTAEGLRAIIRLREDKWGSRLRMLTWLGNEFLCAALAAASAVAFCTGYRKLGGVFAAALGVFVCLFLLAAGRKEAQKRKIFGRIERLADGDVGQRLETEGLTGEVRWLAGTVNALDESLEKAVQARTRSERMKTDLIANVSHDLRTPLTSIISYVDLLKRENIENPRVQEYLTILEDKSSRLRAMAEELMEASRVSSGNLTIEWARIDMVEFLNQAIGEFTERFEASGLTPVVNSVKPPAYIEADGKLLWRILENLCTNACKYALTGSRVYIDLKETPHSLALTMKNISANPLDVPAEELMERFSRGDIARTTEGSGLGLSIAKSITEQMRGKFEIFLDDDLFRVRLVFPACGEGETSLP